MLVGYAGSEKVSGFSIMELLVVIAMMALITAAISPNLIRTPGTQLRISAGEVAAGLKKARLEAQLRRSPVPLVLDVETGGFGTPDLQAQKRIHPDIALTLTTVDQEIQGSGIGAIRFFPDGSSSGGRISLTLNSRSVHVDVEWLTGRVQLLEQAAY